MSFRYIVDDEMDIVIVKATGKISMREIFGEIKEAVETKRGEGISRRLVDLTDQDFFYELRDAEEILNTLQQAAKSLNTKKIALLFKEIPKNFDLEKIIPLLNSPNMRIRIFLDKTKAIEFLNEA
jgi:hypothetical protein